MRFALQKPPLCGKLRCCSLTPWLCTMRGNEILGRGKEKPAGSMGSEVTARDTSRGRCRLEAVISSACENGVQLWEKQLQEEKTP